MVTTKLNLSMTEPQVRQIYAKQGDTGRVLDISLDQTPEDGTLRILRPDGVEVTSEAVTGGEVESGSTFESLTEADVTELSVGIEPVQDLSHGDPSPTNICPITGHDEVTVYFGAEQGTADETYTTSLGQTVYGGTLDMVSGVLTVDKGYYKVTGNENGGYLVGQNNNGNRINFPLESAQSPKYANILSNIGTPTLLTLDSNRWQIGDFCFYTTSVAQLFVIVPNEYTSFATGIAYLNSINAEFVFPLAEPVTYQLTPQQIKTLVGTNNVWASSGDIVSVKFTYGGLLSELPSDATSIVGKCYCDVEQNGVSSMPFTLNVKKNERAT